MGILNYFKDKVQAFRVAKQSGKFRDLAIIKRGERVKAEKSAKTPYEPGTLGLSTVSTEIKKDHGMILNRQERKRYAKANNVAMAKYYNN